MQRFVLMLVGVCAWGAVAVAPARAETRPIQLNMTGTATVLGCVEGGAPPCAGAERVLYSGEASGSPFDGMNYRGPAQVRGYVDLATADFDPESGCYTDLVGTFELFTLRGPREFLAFAEELQGGSSCGSGGHSFHTAFRVDTEATRDPHFRDAVGSGTMLMGDNAVYGTPGVFSAQQNGTIATVR